MSTVTATPNETIYIRNLEELVKPDDLKSTLTTLFSEFGSVIDVVAKQNLKAKGQAFVVFENVESASKAVEEVNGFELFDKPMHIEFARTKSDATIKRLGSSEDLERHKRARVAEKERKQALSAQEAKSKFTAAPLAPKRVGANAENASESTTSRPLKTNKQPNQSGHSGAPGGLRSTAPSVAVVPDEYLPPNKVLFVQNIPADYCDVESLSAIFSRFEGFLEVRLVPGRSGIAFVEYEEQAGAIAAKERIAGMAFGSEGKKIKVTFQRQ